MMEAFRDGIIATSPPGMAATNALECQPTTLKNAVLLHRLQGIGTASGLKTARCRRVGRNDQLIKANQSPDGKANQFDGKLQNAFEQADKTLCIDADRSAYSTMELWENKQIPSNWQPEATKAR